MNHRLDEDATIRARNDAAVERCTNDFNGRLTTLLGSLDAGVPFQRSVDAGRLQRFISNFVSWRDDGDRPLGISIGYFRPDGLELNGCIELLENPASISVNEDDTVIVMAAVILGNFGRSLAQRETDSHRLRSRSNGFVVRHARQVFPILEFSTEHQAHAAWSNVQQQVLVEVNAIF